MAEPPERFWARNDAALDYLTSGVEAGEVGERAVGQHDRRGVRQQRGSRWGSFLIDCLVLPSAGPHPVIGTLTLSPPAPCRLRMLFKCWQTCSAHHPLPPHRPEIVDFLAMLLLPGIEPIRHVSHHQHVCRSPAISVRGERRLHLSHAARPPRRGLSPAIGASLRSKRGPKRKRVCRLAPVDVGSGPASFPGGDPVDSWGTSVMPVQRAAGCCRSWCCSSRRWPAASW